MPRGRPIGSEIRQRLMDILAIIETGYGYRLHRIYCHIFSPCTREVVYYHLRIGVTLGEFIIEKVVSEQGDYSWGKSVEKTYYCLGPNAQPRKDERIIQAVLAIPPISKKESSSSLSGNKLSKQPHDSKGFTP